MGLRQHPSITCGTRGQRRGHLECQLLGNAKFHPSLLSSACPHHFLKSQGIGHNFPRWNGLELSQGRFGLSVRGNFSMERALKDWSRIPSAVVASPALEVFTKGVDVALEDVGVMLGWMGLLVWELSCCNEPRILATLGCVFKDSFVHEPECQIPHHYWEFFWLQQHQDSPLCLITASPCPNITGR